MQSNFYKLQYIAWTNKKPQFCTRCVCANSAVIKFPLQRSNCLVGCCFFYQKGKFQYYLVNNLRNKKQASRRKDRPLWKVVISGGKRLLGRIIHSPSKLIITEPVQASYVHILRKLMQAAFPLCYPHQIGSTKKHKHTGASCQHINPAWATWLSVNRSSDLEKWEHSGADMGSYLL